MPEPTLNLLVLKTHQPELLRAFYSVLGLSFAEEKHGNGPLHYAARLGSLVLELYPLSSRAAPADTGTRLGFTVADLAGVVGVLAARGAMFVGEPVPNEPAGPVVVCDPDGRKVELVQAPSNSTVG